MEINDLAKLILFVGLTVSCVGISYQIMRLLSALTDNVRDLRKTVKNMGVLTDGLVKDQKLISEGIKGFVDAGRKVKGAVNLMYDKIVEPITVIAGFLSTIGGFLQMISQKVGISKER